MAMYSRLIMPDLLPYELLNGTHRINGSVKYEERLLPQVVVDLAADDPNHLADTAQPRRFPSYL